MPEETFTNNDTRIILAVISAIVIILLTIISFVFIDEMRDRSTERACVEHITDDTSYRCDL